MLTVRHLTVTYSDPVPFSPIYKLDADFTVGAYAITGPSGSGKSTLLRVLAGLQQPTTGSIELDRRPLRTSKARVINDRISLIHQDYRLVDFLTVDDNLALGASLRGLSLTQAEIDQALNDVGLVGFGARMPATLSGGQQQRVAIARALTAGSRVILADEPTGALDEDNSVAVARLLVSCADNGAIVIVATHDRAVAALMTHRIDLSSGSLNVVSTQ